MPQLENAIIPPVAEPQTNNSLPSVDVQIKNIGSMPIDTAAITSQLQYVLAAVSEMSPEHLKKIDSIQFEVPAAIVIGSPCVTSVTLK